MNLVDASYQSKNSGTLAAAVRNVNRVRYLARLSKDLRLLSVDGYEFAAKGAGRNWPHDGRVVEEREGSRRQ